MKQNIAFVVGLLVFIAPIRAGQRPEKSAVAPGAESPSIQTPCAGPSRSPCRGSTARRISGKPSAPDSTQPAQSSSGVPSGMIAFFASAACPAGWTESASAQGRVLVGITDPAEAESIGEPLGDREAPRHEHDFAADIMRDARLVPVNSPFGTAAKYIEVLELRRSTSPADSQLPFLQLLACSKD